MISRTHDKRRPCTGRALRLLAALSVLFGVTLDAQAETKLDFWHSYQPPGGPIHYSFHIANYKRGIFFGSCGPSTRSLQWEYDIDLAGPGPVYQKEQLNITSEGKKIDVLSGTIVVTPNQRETSINLKVQLKSGATDFLANGTHSVQEAEVIRHASVLPTFRRWFMYERRPLNSCGKNSRFGGHTGRMNTSFSRKLASLWACSLILAGAMRADVVDVTQHHNHESRDGFYVDPAFTRTAAAGLKRDLGFSGVIQGNVYAQPLYIEGGSSGKAMVIAVTESNNVYALDAINGSVIWRTNVGTPVSRSKLQCGDIDPLGITGTPVVDLPSRALFFDAMTTPDAGTTKRHLIYSLNVDTGAVNPGWPIDVNASARFGATVFDSTVQNERGALAIVGGTLYVPYGGHAGDCGSYHGWIISVPIDNPAGLTAWATAATGGGAWSVGGVASDGVDPFLATGNTFGAGVWSGGESIIRFKAGAVFSNQTNHFWAPTNWASLDASDTDLGGSSAMVVDVPGAAPSQLIVALGKDGNAYLLNRTNLGGVSPPLARAHISSSAIIQAAATYRTTKGTYVVCGANSTQLSAFRILPTAPPVISNAWAVSQSGKGSPFVTSTDGTNNIVVWGIGCEGDQRLHAFDPDTGAAIYSGGGANELMSGTHRFSTAIVARGRIYVATDNKVYAFAVPPSPIVLANFGFLPDGSFQFGFSGTPGTAFTVLGTTNLANAATNWNSLGAASEVSPGQFQFVDPLAPANSPQRFYRVKAP